MEWRQNMTPRCERLCLRFQRALILAKDPWQLSAGHRDVTAGFLGPPCIATAVINRSS
jgi:hypothetical protein